MLLHNTFLSSIAAIQLLLTSVVRASGSSSEATYFLSNDISVITTRCAIESPSRLILLFQDDRCVENGCPELAEALKNCYQDKLYIDAESDVTSLKKYVFGEAIKDIEFDGIYIKNDAANAEAKIADVLSAASFSKPDIVVVASSFDEPLLEHATEVRLNFPGKVSEEKLKSWVDPKLKVSILTPHPRSQTAIPSIDSIEGVEFIKAASAEGVRKFSEFVRPTSIIEDDDDFSDKKFKQATRIPPPPPPYRIFPSPLFGTFSPSLSGSDSGSFVGAAAMAGGELESKPITKLESESAVDRVSKAIAESQTTSTSGLESKVIVDPVTESAVDPVSHVTAELESKSASEPESKSIIEPRSSSSVDTGIKPATQVLTSTAPSDVGAAEKSFASVRITLPIYTSTITETHTTTMTSSKTCDGDSSCEMATSTASFVVRVELCVSVPTDCVVCQPKETRAYKCLEGECPQDKVSPVTRNFGTPVTRVGRSAIAGEGWSVEAQPTKFAPIETITLTECEDQTCRTTAIPMMVESAKPSAAGLAQSDLRKPCLDYDSHEMLPEMLGKSMDHSAVDHAHSQLLPEDVENRMGSHSDWSHPRVSSDKLGQPHRHMSQTGAPNPSQINAATLNAPLPKVSGVPPSQSLISKPKSHSSAAEKPITTIEKHEGMAARSTCNLLAVGALILALA